MPAPASPLKDFIVLDARTAKPIKSGNGYLHVTAHNRRDAASRAQECVGSRQPFHVVDKEKWLNRVDA